MSDLAIASQIRALQAELGTAGLSESDLVEHVTTFYEGEEFANHDMGNGFRSGIEAVLDITDEVELEDLSDLDRAEREAYLAEIRERVAESFTGSSAKATRTQ